jgi:cytochrome c553
MYVSSERGVVSSSDWREGVRGCRLRASFHVQSCWNPVTPNVAKRMKAFVAGSAIAIILVAAVQLTVHGEQTSYPFGPQPTRVRIADRTVWDSVFTLAQAQRGDSIYKAGCVTCHGDQLQGGTTKDFGDSKPLVGSDFMAGWSGQTLADLYDKIFSSMPADKPKTLDKQVIVDVMAHILNQNHFPAGSKELGTDHDSLNVVKIVPAKSATPPN